jgi:hypothetical protein
MLSMQANISFGDGTLLFVACLLRKVGALLAETTHILLPIPLFLAYRIFP